MKISKIDGRYPTEPAMLRPDNIQAIAYESDDRIVVRLDDAQHPDFWIELVIEGARVRVERIVDPPSEN